MSRIIANSQGVHGVELRLAVKLELRQRPARIEPVLIPPSAAVLAAAERFGEDAPEQEIALRWEAKEGAAPVVLKKDFVADVVEVAQRYAEPADSLVPHLAVLYGRWGPLWDVKKRQKTLEEIRAELLFLAILAQARGRRQDQLKERLRVAQDLFPEDEVFAPVFLEDCGGEWGYVLAASHDWLRVPAMPKEGGPGWWEQKVVLPSLCRLLERGGKYEVRIAGEGTDRTLFVTWRPKDAYTLAAAYLVMGQPAYWLCPCGCGRAVLRKGAYFEPKCRHRAYRLRHPEVAVKAWLKGMATRGEISNLPEACRVVDRVAAELGLEENRKKGRFASPPAREQYRDLLAEMKRRVAQKLGL